MLKDNKDNDVKLNIFFANIAFAYVIVLMVLWTLNAMGLYSYGDDKEFFTIIVFLTSIVLLVPTFIVHVLKLKGGYVKYINVFINAFLVGMMYVFFSTDAIMALALPILSSIIFVDKKLLRTSLVLSLITIIVSHPLSIKYSIIENDPFINVYESIVYGAIPRIVILFLLFFVAYMVNASADKTTNQMEVYSLESNEYKKVIKEVVSKAKRISESSSLMKLEDNMVICVKGVIDYLLKKESNNKIFTGMLLDDDSYRFIDENLDEIGDEIKLCDDSVSFNFAKTNIKIPLQGNEEDNISIKDNYLRITFYQNNKLSAFLTVEFLGGVDKFIIHEIAKIFYNTLRLNIANVRLVEQKMFTQTELIMAFAEISESKSNQTGKHIKRVSEYMKVFGKHICSDEKECEYLSIASMLHDIGKIVIPAEILDKPGRLTKEEFDFIKKHTQFGGELLNNIPGRVMKIAKDISENHHERWDGNGYSGLKGDEIEFYSRYVSVIDVFDALVSKRSYKEAWQLDEAYEEIVKNKGTQFAPEAVELFEQCYNELVEIYKSYPDD